MDNQYSTAKEYLDLIQNSWPLLLVCFFSAFLWGLKKIKNGYKLRNKSAIIGNILFTSLGAMVLGFGCVLLLPYIIPEVSASIELGVSIMVAILGQKVLDVILMKKFGLKTLDLMDSDDMDHIHEHMSMPDRIQHAKQCPFKGDMDCPNCESCPQRMKNNEANP